jgi:hypothetical protein
MKHFRTVLSRGNTGSTTDGQDGQAVYVKESDLYINLVGPILVKSIDQELSKTYIYLYMVKIIILPVI